MTEKEPTKKPPPPEPADPPARGRKPFERPKLVRRGTLPAVTTAFGGSFGP